MDNQNTFDNLKLIRKMARDNTTLFSMALTHLFSRGTENFTEIAYAKTLESIEEKHKQAVQHGNMLFITLEFETAILDMAYQLSKIPLFDILLYVKKDMIIHDPEADDDSEDDSRAYTLEEVRDLRNLPAWLEVDGVRILVIIEGYEWRQGHVPEWMSFCNHSRLPLVRYKDEWVLYPYCCEM